MPFSKKHKLVGITCLAALMLQLLISPLGAVLPYAAFCICSLLVIPCGRKTADVVKIAVCGMVVLPVFDFIFSMLCAPLMTSLFAAVLVALVQKAVYVAAFLLMHSWIVKRKLLCTLPASIALVACVAVCAVCEGTQVLVLSNALAQGDLLSAIGGSRISSILSAVAFYGALLFTSANCIKES